MSVYFLRRKGDAAGLIKAGWTSDLAVRLSQYATYLPEGFDLILELPAGTAAHERWFRRKFREFCISGEWYRPDPILLDFIATVGGSGLAAFPSDLPDKTFWQIRAPVGSELAAALCQALVSPAEPGETIAQQISRCADLTGLTYHRVRGLWYQDARTVAFEEIDLLKEAVATYGTTAECLSLLQTAAARESRRLLQLDERLGGTHRARTAGPLAPGSRDGGAG